MPPLIGWDDCSIQTFNISGGTALISPVVQYQQVQPSFYYDQHMCSFSDHAYAKSTTEVEHRRI
ncbi:hypothetical protein CDL15_Pgr020953 [Punica granatum]|uniref:Uncharacterized protein n=1 Tax=Punica granatum TaxID=22663 RepID=A0A218Y0P3_PUNGR|nr:hypothetical protein CDL15_Pgr020953 [Punica granatum]